MIKNQTQGDPHCAVQTGNSHENWKTEKGKNEKNHYIHNHIDGTGSLRGASGPSI
jgi:hypothetical protein